MTESSNKEADGCGSIVMVALIILSMLAINWRLDKIEHRLDAIEAMEL